MFKPFVPDDVLPSVEAVLKSGWVGQGPKVDEFEAALRRVVGNQNLATVNSGTSALRLALSLAGVGPGDEVITPAQTSQATNTPIMEQFAKPVFADVRYESCTLDPSDIEHRITNNTKAIMCVDWGGYPCDLNELANIARQHNLSLIEDAAHAFGASYMGKPVGAISQFTAFSFQAIKHITTTDGGLITFRDESACQKARRMRWYGIDREARKPSILGVDPTFDITEAGYKYHMNDVAAAIGLVQLGHLPKILEQRQEIAKRYREELSRIGNIELFESTSDRESANWLFCFHVKKREEFARHMTEKGVEVSTVNWRNDKYTIFGGMRKDLPNTDRIYADLIGIPLHNGLSDGDVEYVISAVRDRSWM